MISADTIVALSSATGPAARLIIRTSGEAAFDALRSTTQTPIAPAGGRAFSCLLQFADLACPATVYTFQAPRTYTGEDLVEYHLPGNPILAELLLKHFQSIGLRQAEAGEFTARAYFNGRIDLTQAEGVAATVAAQSEQELEAGRRLMNGELAKRLKPPADLVLSTLALLEVGIDFSDEDVTFLPTPELLARVDKCQATLATLLADSSRFKKLGHEPSFVLLGRPNAGKSTLLNALAGYARAVASPIAGTTRDALTADVALRRGFVRLIDVAGLETDGAASQDDIARQMAERAEAEIAQADFVLFLTPADAIETSPLLDRTPDLKIVTKTDLVSRNPSIKSNDTEIYVSATTGDGLEALRQRLDLIAFGKGGASSSLSLNVRHVEAIEAAMRSLSRSADLAKLAGPVELIAAELREALNDLGAVLGQVTPDDLLGQVFSQFCIGK